MKAAKKLLHGYGESGLSSSFNIEINNRGVESAREHPENLESIFYKQNSRRIMKILKLFLFVITALLLLCSCSSISVTSDFDPEYDFNTFKTYRWATMKELNPDDALAKDPLIYKRVQAAVDEVMAAKGIELVETDNFNFVIIAHAGVKERTQVHNTGGGYYGGWYDPYWGPYGGSTHVSNYEEGTLVIDIVHWENKEMAWRGLGTGVLKEIDDPDEVTEYINMWVGKIMAQFPPAK